MTYQHPCKCYGTVYNFAFIISFMCIYSFLYFILKSHYHKQRFTPKPRTTLGRHLDAILIPDVNTGAAVCASYDLFVRLIWRERATSAISCVSCKLWRHCATHSLVPTAATSCKSPFAIRKASVPRRSMQTLRRGRIQFWNQFQPQIREFGIGGRTRDVISSCKFSEILPIMHFHVILATFQRLTQSGFIAVGLV